MSEQQTNNDQPKSTAERLLAQREDRKEQDAKTFENMMDYSKALNDICQTPNGQLVFKTLIKALDVFTPKSGRDGVALIEINTKRNFYFEFIRPYLEPTVRHDIEG